MYRALADAVDVPIAAGEEETTVWDFERLIDRGGVAVVQPDVTRAGGLRETVRIAELARRRGRRTVTHSWSTGIIKAASLHVLAVLEEAEWFEYCVQTTELNQRLVHEQFPVVDGMVEVPTAPGARRHARRRRARGVPGRVSSRRPSVRWRMPCEAPQERTA